MADARVTELMREQKAGLMGREETQQAAMALRWLQVEESVLNDITALTNEMAEREANGRPVTVESLLSLSRYIDLLVQLDTQIASFNEWSGDRITTWQDEIIALGVDYSSINIETVLMEQGQSLGAAFNRLPIEAVANMAGLAGNGSPLIDLLEERVNAPDLAQRMATILVNNTAKGINPRQTAREMQDALGGGLNNALRISRTEQLRVFRETAYQSYAESGVVIGYRRLTAHDARVCPACLSREGEFYPVGVTMPEHPQGRCTPVPVVRGAPRPDWLKGEDWFNTQPRETQLSIMGPGRLAKWEAGRLAFSRMAKVVPNAIWGDSLATNPIGN